MDLDEGLGVGDGDGGIKRRREGIGEVDGRGKRRKGEPLQERI